MSSLSLSHVPTSPRDDAIQLYRAFKGTYNNQLSPYFSNNNSINEILPVIL